MKPALGPRRRLQAMSRMGWTRRMLADVTGLHPETLKRLMTDRSTILHDETAARIDAAFILFAHRLPKPRDPAHAWAMSQARAFAAAQGWPPPAAWDDPDDPNEQPVGFRPGDGGVTASTAEIVGLLRDGVSPVEIGNRLGVHPASLARRLRRHGLHRYAALCERRY